jgi:hypothetical protein
VYEAAREVALFLGEDSLAFRYRHSGHMFQDGDLEVIQAMLMHPTVTRLKATIGDFSESPIDVESAWMPWAAPGVHMLWTENQHIVMGHAQRIVAHTCAPFVDMLVNGQIFARGAAENGVVEFMLAADDVPGGVVTLTTDGPLNPRSVTIQSVNAHILLRNGASRDNVGGGTQFGFTGRLANRENVRLYHRSDGTETRQRTTLYQGAGSWVTPYGVRSNGITGTDPQRAHVLRGIEFEAMPGFAFEFAFQDALHLAEQPRASWEAAGGRPTTWDIDIHAQLHTDVDGQPVAVLEFSAPVNPHDFGIGVNGGAAFALVWYNSQTLGIFFQEGTPQPDGLVIYIARARAEGADMPQDLISTPIRIEL